MKVSTDITLKTGLTREMGTLGLTATGICSMLGASIYVMPFMIQRNVPGIGPYVLPAFLLAAIPAILAAFAYSILASAMPRAGGSYIYASRGLNPYLGFVASFSQWFGLSIVIGVVSYVIVPFIRDIAFALDWQGDGSFTRNGLGAGKFSRLIIVDICNCQYPRYQIVRAYSNSTNVLDVFPRGHCNYCRLLLYA